MEDSSVQHKVDANLNIRTKLGVQVPEGLHLLWVALWVQQEKPRFLHELGYTVGNLDLFWWLLLP